MALGVTATTGASLFFILNYFKKTRKKLKRLFQK
jgi:hypothetical protein